MRIEVDRFTCSDEDGEAFVVIVRREFIEVDLLTGPPELVGDVRDFVLEDGRAVTRIDGKDGTFKIAGTNRILHAIVND
jgi:hypothetical protein